MTKRIDRRLLLRGTGVALSLPLLDSMLGRAWADAAGNAVRPADATLSDASSASSRRMLCIGTPFGFDPETFIPTTTGREYTPPAILAKIAEHRDDFSIISGLCHPETKSASHKSEPVLLTGAPNPGTPQFRNTVSLDQVAAEHFRGQTRFDSLALTTFYGSLSFTRTGVEIPADSSPSKIFAQLFLNGDANQAALELRMINEGRSTLDTVATQAKKLRASVGPGDQQRLDEYFDSVRDVERQLHMAERWVHTPKPKVDLPQPSDIQGPGQQEARLRLMFDMIHLAFATDSTRTITIRTFGDHHDLSHHGKEPGKLEDCRKVEADLITAVGSLLTKFKQSKEGEASLLDRTMVLVTSNLRDGNTHWTDNLPVLLAGGGFKHGQHLGFNPKFLEDLGGKQRESNGEPARALANTPPLCNLYVSMLQRMGVPTGAFGSGNATLAGLEIA